ncbi:hypothetical protein PIIN_10380 [Serendipita indica DSM 11827]|uniref:Uncharacterized protein n=1 Tax=Serendipita indica (strain DSM 11827) TaxID=1109443 RepID=G4TYJ4_SERID|nr:hypothetical protein PIIN_10380 [Serendipita indica DSM 11827]
MESGHTADGSYNVGVTVRHLTISRAKSSRIRFIRGTAGENPNRLVSNPTIRTPKLRTGSFGPISQWKNRKYKSIQNLHMNKDTFVGFQLDYLDRHSLTDLMVTALIYAVKLMLLHSIISAVCRPLGSESQPCVARCRESLGSVLVHLLVNPPPLLADFGH